MTFRSTSARACRALSLVAAATSFVVFATAARAFDPWTDSAHYAFSYRVALDAIPAEPGDRMRLWIPLPAETRDQRVIEREIESTYLMDEETDPLGNEMVQVVWQGPATPGAALTLTTVVERRPSKGMPASEVVSGSSDDPKRCTPTSSATAFPSRA
jgi:hypothetical protein